MKYYPLIKWHIDEYSGLHVQSVRLKGNRKITDWLVELYQKLWHCKTCLRTAKRLWAWQYHNSWYVVIKPVNGFPSSGTSVSKIPESWFPWARIFNIDFKIVISKLSQKLCSRFLASIWNHWFYKIFKNISKYCHCRLKIFLSLLVYLLIILIQLDFFLFFQSFTHPTSTFHTVSSCDTLVWIRYGTSIFNVHMIISNIPLWSAYISLRLACDTFLILAP